MILHRSTDSSSSDLSSSLVQEIAASLTDQPVSDKYIHKDGYPPAEGAIAGDLLIDFSRLSAEDELGKLRSALSTWGCFQVVNHGMETELVEKVLEVSRQFFALPLEEKKKSYGAAWLYNGYGNDGELWGNQTQNWNDRLYLRVGSNDPANLGFWPENPPEFRKTVREVGDKIQEMREILLKAMARSLDLEEDCFLKHHGLDGGYTFTMLNFWGSLRTRMGPPLPCSSKINKALKSWQMIVGSRAVTNSEKERVSVAMFYNPSTFKEIGPVDELVTAERPQLYKKTSIIKYGQVYRDFNPKGNRTLSAFKM